MVNPAWAGKDKPNLEPQPDEEFNVDIPGYDMRRLMAAEDPLAAANVFLSKFEPCLQRFSESACVRFARIAPSHQGLVKTPLAALLRSWEGCLVAWMRCLVPWNVKKPQVHLTPKNKNN